MMILKSFRVPTFVAAAVTAAGLSGVAGAGEVIYQTNDPFGGFLGINGFDVFINQSVATRFTPAVDHSLTDFSVWMWNNDESGGEPTVTLTLRTDDDTNGESRPSNVVLEEWELVIPNTGIFNPAEFTLTSTLNPTVVGGQRYWIVAESLALGLEDAVWAWAANDSGVTTNTDFFTGEWYPAPEQGAVATLIVRGTPAGGTPGDVDGDGDVDLGDLAALLGSFGACSGDANFNAGADFDNTGCIELGDLALLLANFGA